MTDFFNTKDFFLPKTNPWSMVTNDQLAFVKFMVEDEEFLYYYAKSIDQNLFSPPELRKIVRAIKDLADAKEDVTYDRLIEMMQPEGELDESQEISWMITTALIDEMKGDDCLERSNPVKLKEFFIKKLDAVADEKYDDSSAWV